MITAPRGHRLQTGWSAIRVIVAVAAGYLTNAVLIAGSEHLLSKFAPAGTYFAADVLTQSVIQIGCGYLCSRISNSYRLTATVVLIALGILVGSVSIIASWHSEPHWYAITLLCIYGPCVWVGYRWEQHIRAENCQ